MANISEITSTQNNLVKYAVKLLNSSFRKSEKMIFADGEKTIQGLVDSGVEFEYFFLKKDSAFKTDKIKTKNLVFVGDEILKKISSTKSPVNLAGIIKEPFVDKKIFNKLNKIALIEDIKDAGNLGTIIRSACAFSIEGIILFGDCVDLYNTKTIRATAQNMFKIPVITTNDINFILELKKTRKLIATVVNSKKDFFNYNFDDKFIMAFGSEACGLSEKITGISDEKLTLKMDNNVESINLAICASIAFAAIRFNK